jgi:hypothetical protein
VLLLGGFFTYEEVAHANLWSIECGRPGVVLVACGTVPADDATSGIKVGGSIGSYSGTKCGGIEDGVEAGKSLCYT